MAVAEPFVSQPERRFRGARQQVFSANGMGTYAALGAFALIVVVRFLRLSLLQTARSFRQGRLWALPA